MNIITKRFDKNFPLPAPQPGAACFDFVCRETVTIEPHSIKPIAQNVAMKVPTGYVLLLFVRSSTPLRKGLQLANNVGVIDPFYCGDDDEILAFMHNFTDKAVTVEAGDKIVQGMILKTEAVAWDEVERMDNDGHGGYQHHDELSKN